MQTTKATRTVRFSIQVDSATGPGRWLEMDAAATVQDARRRANNLSRQYPAHEVRITKVTTEAEVIEHTPEG